VVRANWDVHPRLIDGQRDRERARVDAYGHAVQYFRSQRVMFLFHYRAGPPRALLDDAGWLQPPPSKKSSKKAKARVQFLAKTDPRTFGPAPFFAYLPDTVDLRAPKAK
jgi:hypothetical protein